MKYAADHFAASAHAEALATTAPWQQAANRSVGEGASSADRPELQRLAQRHRRGGGRCVMSTKWRQVPAENRRHRPIQVPRRVRPLQRHRTAAGVVIDNARHRLSRIGNREGRQAPLSHPCDSIPKSPARAGARGPSQDRPQGLSNPIPSRQQLCRSHKTCHARTLMPEFPHRSLAHARRRCLRRQTAWWGWDDGVGSGRCRGRLGGPPVMIRGGSWRVFR